MKNEKFSGAVVRDSQTNSDDITISEVKSFMKLRQRLDSEYGDVGWCLKNG